jgi:hypothetical protein
MTVYQTKFFRDDVEHYTNLALEYRYTTARDDIKQSIFRLEKLRGKEYVKKLAAKCNQKAKMKFYEV